MYNFFFFQAEDGIRDHCVTGVQTCALPIYKTQIVELQKGHDNLTRLHATITKENGSLKEDNAKLKDELGDVAELRKQIAVLEQELTGKEELIETLKTRPAIIDGEVIDPDRPQMEQVFVDPLEEDAGEGMKSSIQIDTIEKEDEVDNKVDKLRDLLGSKLPKKKEVELT